MAPKPLLTCQTLQHLLWANVKSMSCFFIKSRWLVWHTMIAWQRQAGAEPGQEGALIGQMVPCRTVFVGYLPQDFPPMFLLSCWGKWHGKFWGKSGMQKWHVHLTIHACSAKSYVPWSCCQSGNIWKMHRGMFTEAWPGNQIIEPNPNPETLCSFWGFLGTCLLRPQLTMVRLECRFAWSWTFILRPCPAARDWHAYVPLSQHTIACWIGQWNSRDTDNTRYLKWHGIIWYIWYSSNI